MVWKPFETARCEGGVGPELNSDDRLEITCALIMGATFEQRDPEQHHNHWTCGEPRKMTHGWWQFKANAARAYLSTKGVFFDREGNPVEHATTIATVKAMGGEKE